MSGGKRIYRICFLECKPIGSGPAPWEAAEKLRIKVYAPHSEEPFAEPSWDSAVQVDVTGASESDEIRVTFEEMRSSSSFCSPSFLGELLLLLSSASSEPIYAHLKTRRNGTSKALIKLSFSCVLGAPPPAPIKDLHILALLESTCQHNTSTSSQIPTSSASSASSASPPIPRARGARDPVKTARRLSIMDRNAVRRVLSLQIPREEPFVSIGLQQSVRSLPFTDRTLVGDLLFMLLQKPGLSQLSLTEKDFVLFCDSVPLDPSSNLLQQWRSSCVYTIRAVSQLKSPLPPDLSFPAAVAPVSAALSPVFPNSPCRFPPPPSGSSSTDAAAPPRKPTSVLTKDAPFTLSGHNLRARLTKKLTSSAKIQQQDVSISGPSGDMQHRAHIGVDSASGSLEACNLDPSMQAAILKIAVAPRPEPGILSASPPSKPLPAVPEKRSPTPSDAALPTAGVDSGSGVSRGRSGSGIGKPGSGVGRTGGSKKRFPTPLFHQRVRESTETGCSELDLSGLDLDDSTHFSAQVPSAVRHELVILDLGFNEFTVIPHFTVFKLLTELSLDGNHLTELSGDIEELSCLQKLSIAGNQLTQISPKISHLSRLQRLNLSNNKLSALTSTIPEMTQLTDLVLMGNPLRSLPLNIGKIARLEMLDCQGCQLEYLPESLAQCTRLMELNFGNNHLASLPTDLGRLTRLASLNVADNQLSDLPVSLGCCEGIATINLSRNPFSNPNIIDKWQIGVDQLVFWLEKRMYSLKQIGEPVFLSEGAAPADERGIRSTKLSLPGASEQGSASPSMFDSPRRLGSPHLADGDPGFQQQQLYQQQLYQQQLYQQQLYQQQLYQQQIAYAQQLAQHQQAMAIQAGTASSPAPASSDSPQALEAKITAVRQAGIMHIKETVTIFKQYQQVIESTEPSTVQQTLVLAQRLKTLSPPIEQMRALIGALPSPTAVSVDPAGRPPELVTLISTLLSILSDLSNVLIGLVKNIQTASSTDQLVKYVRLTKELKDRVVPL